MKIAYEGEYTLRWYDSNTNELKREKVYKNTITSYGRDALVSRGGLRLGTILIYERPTLANPKPDPVYMGSATLNYDVPSPPNYIYNRRKRARFHEKDARNEPVTGKIFYGFGIAFENGGPTLDLWEEHVFSKVILPEEEHFYIDTREYLDIIYTISVIPNTGDSVGSYPGGSYRARRSDIDVPPEASSNYDVAIPMISNVQAFSTQQLGAITDKPTGTSYPVVSEDVQYENNINSSTACITLPYFQGNTPTGMIGSIVTSSPYWDIRYQISFDPPLEKTEENMLRINLTTWFSI